MATDEEQLDPHTAAALIRQTTKHTQQSLIVRANLLYASWGVAWLVGLGTMWLSVRTQMPYRGPSTASAVLLGVLILAAVVATMATVIRATRGVEGASETQGKMFGLSWPIGFATLFALEGALAHHGASDTVTGLVAAAGPPLVTSLIYLVGAAVWLDRSMFAIGAWLALVTAVGAWTGPVTVLLVEAVAGGGGFLLMAAYLTWRGRR